MFCVRLIVRKLVPSVVLQSHILQQAQQLGCNGVSQNVPAENIFTIFANEQLTYFFCSSHFEISYSGAHLANFTGCACVCWQGLSDAFACHRPSCHDLLYFGRTAEPPYPINILMS